MNGMRFGKTAFLLFNSRDKMTSTYTAGHYLLYLLSKRDYSEHELRQKLHRKGYENEEIEQAISHAQAKHWQSDERFCATYLRYRALQGYGPRRLRQELRQKGVKDWLIAQEIEGCEIDWFELAERVFEKKRPREWDLKAKQKMWRYMVSHGFSNDHFSHLMSGNYAYEDDYDE